MIPEICFWRPLRFPWTSQVIENHSKQQERQRQDDTAELDQREEEEEEEDEGQEVCTVDHGDAISPDVSFGSQSSPDTEGRLVKSHSEAPIGSPRGQWGGLWSSQVFLKQLIWSLYEGYILLYFYVFVYLFIPVEFCRTELQRQIFIRTFCTRLCERIHIFSKSH